MSKTANSEISIHGTETGRFSGTALNYSNTPKSGHLPMTQGTEESDASDSAITQRIQKALAIAVRYGGLTDPEMKDWTLDQMVRALTGCPLVKQSMFTKEGTPCVVFELGASDEYLKLVADARAGEDGPETYSWNTGRHPSVIAPSEDPSS